MRAIFARWAQANEGIDEFALRRLAFDPDGVPRSILAAAAERGHRSIVVSGLRSPRELHSLMSHAETQTVIFVDASAPLRHQRCLNRGRSDTMNSFDAFLTRDEMHNRMGLELIRTDPATITIVNEGSLADFGKTLLNVTERAR
jgi:ribose 1,5-bisphosphokinase PhnN